MKIKHIKKTNSGKYKIKLDNNETLITYDDVILKNSLLFNKEIDTKKLNEINKDTKYFDIYNKLIKMISTRLRSEKEVTDYLNKNFVSEIEQKTIINKLKEIGFINDLVFAKAYTSDKVHLSNSGPYKISQDLTNYNIDENYIEEAISSIDKSIIEEKLVKIITKKIKSNNKHSSYILKQKLVTELSLNGFDKDMIISLYEKLSTSEDDILNREYLKIKTKLERKYSGNELYKKIKEKLYQKGFDIALINEYFSSIN